MRARLLAAVLVSMVLVTAATHLRHTLVNGSSVARIGAAPRTGQLAAAPLPDAPAVRADAGAQPEAPWCSVLAVPCREPDLRPLLAAAVLLVISGAALATSQRAHISRVEPLRAVRRRALLQVYLI